MMRRAPRMVLLLAPIAALAACQGADVGQHCNLTWGPPPATAPSASYLWDGNCASGQQPPCGGDYVEFNNVECENLVCIVSPVPDTSEYWSTTPGLGYCSKPCVSNKDCYQSETGLVCRTIVLDSTFLASLDPATKDRYLGDIQYSSYCGTP